MKAGAESVPGKLGRQELTRLVETGEIETVLAVFPDFYGRLLGKRFVGRFFVEGVAAHGFHACDYLLDRHIRAGRGDRLALTGPAGGYRLNKSPDEITAAIKEQFSKDIQSAGLTSSVIGGMVTGV